ncbi:unnamed protein product [Malus baccata var. baccata]
MKIIMQNLIDRLRPLVGLKGWDNCVLWKLSEDKGDETRVLVPSSGGLIEMFASKDVSEDQQVIDFITVQCNISHEQYILLNASTKTSFTVDINNMSSDTRPKAFLVDENEGNDHLNNIHSFQQQPVFPVMALDHISNLPCDITVDQIRLCSTFPMNFLQNSNNDTVYNFDQGSHESLGEVGLRADSDAHKLHNNIRQVVDDQDSIKHKGGRTANHSASDCTDQFDDDGGTNYRRRTGKKPQSKNLVAERKRRKKLNETLYDCLRSLVPNISKLEQLSNDGGSKKRNANNTCGNHTNLQPETLSQNGNTIVNKQGTYELPNRFHVGIEGDIGNIFKQNQESDITNDRGQEMEPQVRVIQLDGNEFFVTVLMEALDSLGLEETNALTSLRSLVSNVFKVEKKDTAIVQADHVRDNLLEITRNPSSKMMAKALGNVSPLNHFQHDHYQQHHLHDYHASSYHLQHLYT